RGVEPVDLESNPRAGGRIELILQALNVGRLFTRVDKALVPEPGVGWVCCHALSLKASEHDRESAARSSSRWPRVCQRDANAISYARAMRHAFRNAEKRASG